MDENGFGDEITARLLKYFARDDNQVCKHTVRALAMFEIHDFLISFTLWLLCRRSTAFYCAVRMSHCGTRRNESQSKQCNERLWL